jgi:glycopeptide antibiotics resistance protein
MDADIARILGGLPWAGPAALCAVLVAAVLASSVASQIGKTAAGTFLLLASLGAIIGTTLTPSVDVVHSTQCDLTFVAPTLTELQTPNDRSLNVALFIPLGIALVANRIRSGWVLLAAASVSPLVELTQRVAAPLNRTCQAIDLIDNELGLVIGMAAGTIGWWIWRRARPST